MRWIKSLRTKIFLSFLLLILMLAIAGVMSILEFKKMGSSVDVVLKNNYQSIESAKIMLDAVGEMESGIMICLLGNMQKGEMTIITADSIMNIAIQKARSNISETNEEQQIIEIEKEYSKLNTIANKIASSEKSSDDKIVLYEMSAKKHYIDTKNAINKLMVINQDKMYKQATIAKENSQRAMMPAIISVIAAVIFAILLNIFISIYFIGPINRLIKEVKYYYPEKGEINAKINSTDEIKTLEQEINQLIRRSK